jgi:hypothetical protein
MQDYVHVYILRNEMVSAEDPKLMIGNTEKAHKYLIIILKVYQMKPTCLSITSYLCMYLCISFTCEICMYVPIDLLVKGHFMKLINDLII